MTPERAAKVLRNVGNERYTEEKLAGEMGADALKFQGWLFATISPWGSIRVHELYLDWHGEDSFLDYCKAEWEKERKG
jgi:hypothetical protein